MQQNNNTPAKQGQSNEQISRVLASYPTETIDKPKVTNQRINNINDLKPEKSNFATNNYQNQMGGILANEQSNLQNNFRNIGQANYQQQDNNMFSNLLKVLLGSQNGNSGGDIVSSLSSLIGNLGLKANENNANLLSSIMQSSATNSSTTAAINENTGLIKKFCKVEDIEIEN